MERIKDSRGLPLHSNDQGALKVEDESTLSIDAQLDEFFSENQTSGERSATAQIVSLPGKLQYVDIQPPVAGTSTLKIYDSVGGATSLIFSATIPAGFPSINISCNRDFAAGAYAVLSGFATTYVIGYKT